MTGSRRSRTRPAARQHDRHVDSNNGVSLIQSGEYDGISASGDATTRLIAERPRRADRHERVRELRRGLRQPEGPAPQHRRWRQLRRSHGRGANVLGLEHRHGHRGPDVVGHRSGSGGADYAGNISIYDSSIFIADAALHLMTDAAGSGDRGPVPAEPGAVRRGDRPPRGPRMRTIRSTGARGRSDRLIRLRRRHGRDDLAVPGEQLDGGTSRSRRSSRMRAPPAGPTPG